MPIVKFIFHNPCVINNKCCKRKDKKITCKQHLEGLISLKFFCFPFEALKSSLTITKPIGYAPPLGVEITKPTLTAFPPMVRI